MGAQSPTGPSGSAQAMHRPRGQLVHGAGGTSGRVLDLNATYEPINVCTVRRAVVLLLKDKAELLDQAVWRLHSEHATHPRQITRRAVFARDRWTCQYCGARSNLTVDHVIPRSKGGGADWENIVAC